MLSSFALIPPGSFAHHSLEGVAEGAYAIDPEAAERLWTLSEDLTGVKFDS
ncbi:hypothetical protein [Edaphobacter bradus]|uniref:hypothetical protein n=1 Tax=Edaphobacter bradus TaxID=2259016 RepID=UPI0021DFC557|nr:hypothetical protein [Edaphobacter bradus]